MKNKNICQFLFILVILLLLLLVFSSWQFLSYQIRRSKALDPEMLMQYQFGIDYKNLEAVLKALEK